MIFELKDGLKIGMGSDIVVHKEVELRKVTIFLLNDAKIAAERPVSTPDGYKLIVSENTLNTEILRRQIKRIGDIQGPVSEAELRSLSDDDLELIFDNAEELSLAEDMPTEGRLAAEPAAD